MVWSPATGFRTLPRGFAGGGLAINNSGQVAGSATWHQGPGVQRPTRWSDGQAQQLAEAGVAQGINEDGTVVGYTQTATSGGFHHPVLWDPVSGLRDLGILRSGPGSGSAYAANDHGHVVGNADSGADGVRAFLWRAGRMAAIGPKTSFAYAVNNADHAVGQAAVRGAYHAFLYRDGRSVDLNNAIPRGSIVLESGRGINDAGWIVADGRNASGQQRAFVLIPR
ncbi:MAG TPA: hypothetical protein VES42_10510 [Pilimelia sp.]|nr:hypothetical protein [Pilimelia sp.]